MKVLHRSCQGEEHFEILDFDPETDTELLKELSKCLFFGAFSKYIVPKIAKYMETSDD